jgi:hypothetical protein
MSAEQYTKRDYVLKYSTYSAKGVSCNTIRGQGSIGSAAIAIVATDAGGDRHHTYKK